MKYACLIYSDEADTVANPDHSSAEFGEMMGGYMAFGEQYGATAIQAGEALQPSSTATSVQVRDGAVVTTDGPFAETKEQLGGFYIVEAANLDEAIVMATKIPHANTGTIEIRPVMSFDD